jgi:S-adenosylmethionine decarboxylase
MFPERQQGPHREWKDEVQFLDGIFKNGSAYTVGRVNGDHWLLYITNPETDGSTESVPNSPVTVPSVLPENGDAPHTIDEHSIPRSDVEKSQTQDCTIEILMSQLSPEARAPFLSKFMPDSSPETSSNEGITLSSTIGISDLFPPLLTTLDAYSFTPCGYSSNALIKWGDATEDEFFPYGTQQNGGEGYYTIHVTPEEGWSYASFECNVPLSNDPSCQPADIPDLKTLIRRVVKIFQPERLALTLFVSSRNNDDAEDEEGETDIEAAQRAFKAALTPLSLPKSPAGISSPESRCIGERGQRSKRLYKRTDKINYEFGGYDLAFASFELR